MLRQGKKKTGIELLLYGMFCNDSGDFDIRLCCCCYCCYEVASVMSDSVTP